MVHAEKIANGFQLLEGPVWDGATGTLLVADAQAGGVWRVSLEGHVESLIPHRRGIGGMVRHADGGLVISQRGGDFEMTIGQDFSIGYLDHDSERVRLYIEESFTFLILTEQAAIPLSTGGGKKP